MSQAAPIWATATPLSFALRLQKPRLLRQAAPLARLLLSTRFGRHTGPDVATDPAKAGLRKPGATSLRLATSGFAACWQSTTPGAGAPLPASRALRGPPTAGLTRPGGNDRK